MHACTAKVLMQQSKCEHPMSNIHPVRKMAIGSHLTYHGGIVRWGFKTHPACDPQGCMDFAKLEAEAGVLYPRGQAGSTVALLLQAARLRLPAAGAAGNELVRFQPVCTRQALDGL